jgi:2'-5' RNA ligase
MLRLFVAVTLPDDALAACARETRRIEETLGLLARGVRFPRSLGLHFTLRFLGATLEEKVPALREALQASARTAAPFSITLKGLQAFPSAKKPRVVYLGVTEGEDAMKKLAAAVKDQLAPLGFPEEDRPFMAHVTVARVKDLEAAPKIGERLAALPAVEVARVEVKDVALMLSELQSSGSRYTALERARLSAG